MIDPGTQRHTTCGGVNRRAFLRLGGLSVFGLSLPQVLAAQAQQPAETRTDVNCILLWMGGGPSNIDTLDMKPDAPAEYRGEFRPIQTNVAGLQICEHLPRMARQMDRISLIRSVSHRESGDHVAATHYMMTGYPQRPDPTGQPINSTIYPAYGSVVSRELGWRNAMPPYVLVPGRGTVYTGAGYMGRQFDPLRVHGDPNQPAFNIADVTIPAAVGVDRTNNRLQMLNELDRWRQQTQQGQIGQRDQFYHQAFDFITSPAAQRAFRLEEEPVAVRDRYGRTTMGQSCLLARRLIESGVRFVTVHDGRWDTHTDNFNTLRNRQLPELDQYWSALLEDLSQRGMLSNTFVIWMGEFGRTPRVNGQAGRDHWAHTNAICLSGAGINMGTVVGETDRRCERPLGMTHSTHDLAATIYRLLGIDCTQEYRGPDGRPHLINYHGRPITQALA
jgi:hypothetical protein